jgi:hypothetical protein
MQIPEVQACSPLEGAKAAAAVTATCTNAATATSSPYGVDARTTAPLRDDRSKAGSGNKDRHDPRTRGFLYDDRHSPARFLAM